MFFCMSLMALIAGGLHWSDITTATLPKVNTESSSGRLAFTICHFSKSLLLLLVVSSPFKTLSFSIGWHRCVRLIGICSKKLELAALHDWLCISRYPLRWFLTLPLMVFWGSYDWITEGKQSLNTGYVVMILKFQQGYRLRTSWSITLC